MVMATIIEAAMNAFKEKLTSLIPSFRKWLNDKIVHVHFLEKPTKIDLKEDRTMYDPSQILAWLVANVQQMRHSRRKTLSMVVGTALQIKGVGVLALGRVMAGQVAAKHCIKRVW